MSRLFELYRTDIVPTLKKQLGYKNDMEVPRIEKVVVNAGIGSKDAAKRSVVTMPEVINKKGKEKTTMSDGEWIASQITMITGQKAVITTARKAIAGFKIKEGTKVGVKVTLRGKKMYEFLDRTINIALPRVRDFRGLSEKACDGRGNYNIGIKEYTIYYEAKYDHVSQIGGMQICIHTTAKTDEEAISLLRMFNFPFAKHDGNVVKSENMTEKLKVGGVK